MQTLKETLLWIRPVLSSDWSVVDSDDRPQLILNRTPDSRDLLMQMLKIACRLNRKRPVLIEPEEIGDKASLRSSKAVLSRQLFRCYDDG